MTFGRADARWLGELRAPAGRPISEIVLPEKYRLDPASRRLVLRFDSPPAGRLERRRRRSAGKARRGWQWSPEAVAGDTWRPELATGACFICGSPARDGHICCDACADTVSPHRIEGFVRRLTRRTA